MTQKQHPTISVCVPIFNGSKYIKKTLDSLIQQTYQNWEAIIIDDESQDDTVEIIKPFLKKEKRFRFFQNSQNIGMVKNWNKTLDYVQGEYVCFLHQDDFYDKSFLHETLDYFQKNPSLGMVFTANYNVNQRGKPFEINRPFNRNQILDLEDFVQNLHQKGNFIKFPTVVIKSQVYQEIGKYDENLHLTVDLEMWLRISLSYQIGYLNQNLVFYRLHQTNVSNLYMKEGSEITELIKCYQIFLNRAYKVIAKDAYIKIEKLIWESIDNRVFNWRHLFSILQMGGSKAVNHFFSDYLVFRKEKLTSVSFIKFNLLKCFVYLLKNVPYFDRITTNLIIFFINTKRFILKTNI